MPIKSKPLRSSFIRNGKWYAIIAQYSNSTSIRTDTGYTYRRLFTPQIVQIELYPEYSYCPFPSFKSFVGWCSKTDCSYGHKYKVLAHGPEGDLNGLMTPGDAQVKWMNKALKKWNVVNRDIIQEDHKFSISGPVMALGGTPI